ncbi:hypothetical protein Pvag_pPag20048 (plasmid) [Pantoea vagans C9-1]|nr:hypothetical protein Pvag_pPag20048 [Pantoea vagans C9-1]
MYQLTIIHAQGKMMDDADLAHEVQEALIASALSARKPGLTSPDGRCIWCRDEAAVAGTAFCSAECGEDYFRNEHQLKQHYIPSKYPAENSGNK